MLLRMVYCAVTSGKMYILAVTSFFVGWCEEEEEETNEMLRLEHSSDWY